MLRVCALCALAWGLAAEDGSRGMDAEDGSNDMDRVLLGKGPAPDPDPEKPGVCFGEFFSPCFVLDCCIGTDEHCQKSCPYGVMPEATYCTNSGNKMCKQDMLPVLKCPDSSAVPPTGTCKQPTNVFREWGTCVMVDGREDLPYVSSNKTFEVSFLRKTIEGPPTDPKIHLMAEKYGLFHSVVLIQETCTKQRETFFIEFGAEEFGKNVVLPTIHPFGPYGTIAWNNSAYIGWYKTFNVSDWQTNYRAVLGNNVSGSVVNAWLDEVPLWGQNHQKYELWSAFTNYFSKLGLKWAQNVFQDSTCHAFTEWSIQTLHEKGANFKTNQAICRNYQNLYTNDPPIPVIMPFEDEQVVTFYESLKVNINKIMADTGTDTSGQTAFEDWIYYYPTWYVIDQSNNYHQIKLTSPYLMHREALMPMKFSWQSASAFGDGSCMPLGPGLAFASGAVLGSLQAAGQTITV